MKKRLLFLLAALAIAAAAFSQGTNSDNMNKSTSTIKNMEQMMMDALKSSDMQTFASHMANNFVSVYSFGISNRDEELSSLSNLKVDSYNILDARVVQPAPDVAIIAYRYNGSGSYAGEPFTGTYYATTTWVNENGTWKAIAHTEAEEKKMDDNNDEWKQHPDSIGMDADSLQSMPVR